MTQTFQPVTTLSVGGNQYIAPVLISGPQASQFIIDLGSLPTTYTAFQYIKGITIDNTANAAAGVSFIVTTDQGQSWQIGPGTFQIVKVGGNVLSLTITPILWGANTTVNFTLWNTTPSQETLQIGEFTLAGTIQATVTGAVTISNTPNVIIQGVPAVTLSGTGNSVQVVNSPAVTLSGSGNQVQVVNSPAVSVTGTANVAVTNNLDVSTLGTVDISNSYILNQVTNFETIGAASIPLNANANTVIIAAPPAGHAYIIAGISIQLLGIQTPLGGVDQTCILTIQDGAGAVIAFRTQPYCIKTNNIQFQTITDLDNLAIPLTVNQSILGTISGTNFATGDAFVNIAVRLQ